MRCAVLTFGCRVNQADSQRIEETLLAGGAERARASRSDLVIVNTCSVTATAEQGARQAIRRIARDNPDAKIVVTGCYATRSGPELAALPGVIEVVPNERKDRLASTLANTPVRRVAPGSAGPAGALAPGAAGRTARTLSVQTGCGERCSYCIVPLTRGAPRSEPVAGVLARVRHAVAAGFKEVVLTGVHLGSYGRDLEPAASLLALLRALDAGVSEDVLFRIGSLEPMDCPAGVVDLVKGSPRFAPHFHLPLQHASDRILQAMRRPYALDDYRRLVDGLRAQLPYASIGSDIIAGFPGERPADVDAMAAYLDASPLTHVHVFPYSDRPGTEASMLPDKVKGIDVRARARLMREVGQRLADRFRRSQIGAVRRALTIGSGSTAVTDNYLKVRIPPGRPRNEWVRVSLVAAGDQVTGEIV